MLFSAENLQYLWNGARWPRLLLMTNRKSHTHFWLVPKSMTFDDLERPLCTLFQNTCVFGAHVENWMKIDLHYQQHRCRAMTVVSGSIRFMGIFIGVPWREGIKWQWGCQKWQFSVLSVLISSEAWEVRQILLYTVNWGNIVLPGNFERKLRYWYVW